MTSRRTKVFKTYKWQENKISSSNKDTNLLKRSISSNESSVTKPKRNYRREISSLSCDDIRDAHLINQFNVIESNDEKYCLPKVKTIKRSEEEHLMDLDKENIKNNNSVIKSNRTVHTKNGPVMNSDKS